MAKKSIGATIGFGLCCAGALWVFQGPQREACSLLKKSADLAVSRTESMRAGDEVATLLSLTPWAAIGGCGAGGSGGGGAAVKWIGKGVTGGIIDYQLLNSFSLGQNFFNSSYSSRFSYKPLSISGSTIGLSVPVVSKIGEVQPVSNQVPRYYITGGLGDLSLDFSYTVGMSGMFSLNLACGFPTGQYDVKRGSDKASEILPSSLQKGGGLYSTSIGLSMTKDVEDGMWLVDATYSYPVAMKLISGQNEFMDKYFSAYKSYEDSAASPQRNRFYYLFKPYGENDLGAFTPPSLSFRIDYAYKGVEHYMHSWGVTFSAPLGVAWISNYDLETAGYNPKPDPDHKAWSASLNYGLEAGHEKYPIFVGVSVPFHAKKYDPSDPNMPVQKGTDDLSVYEKWYGPDWKDFLQQWTLGIGVKATMF